VLDTQLVVIGPPQCYPTKLDRARLRKQYRNGELSRDVLLNRRLLDATETYGTDRKLGNRFEKPVNPRIAIIHGQEPSLRLC